ncbi:hypothetical protein R1flu_005097 [Riccia fluitans]|uniref:Uncharacterized protein n=1 Tax=Riccia fluitans TaxID=41844 RepID=A0ABD1YS69_9MARC
MRDILGFEGRAPMATNSGKEDAHLCHYAADIEAGITSPEMEVLFRETPSCTTTSGKEGQRAPPSPCKKEGQIFDPVMEKFFGDNSHWASTLADLEVVRKMTQSRGKSKANSRRTDRLLTHGDLLEAMYNWWNSVDSIDCKPKRWMILVLWFILVAGFFMMILACCIIVFVFTSIILWGPMVAVIFFWLFPYCERVQAQFPAYVAGLLTVCSAAVFAFLFVVPTDESSVYKQGVPENWSTLSAMSGNSFSCLAAQQLIGYALFQVAHVCLFTVISLICYGLSNLWSFCCSD